MTDTEPRNRSDGPSAAADESRDGIDPRDDVEDDAVDEDEFGRWYGQLPDFVTIDYPLDVPPNRLPVVRVLFDAVGAWRFCPERSCRRSRACKGGDGPPCYRADRETLSKVLFITWLRMFWGMTEEEWQNAFEFCAPRYAEGEETEAPPRAKRREGGAGRQA